MGNFYTNITLHHTDAAAAADALRALGREAYVAPAIHGTVVVFDQETERQDPNELARLAAALSEHLGCAAIGVLNHDDDVLRYTLHEPGRAPDAYDSAPGYFDGSDQAPGGGDAERLSAAFGRGDRTALERVLHGPDARGMAIDLHAALVELLGLHPAAVGFGYTYLERGELPEGVNAEALLHVSPRTRHSRSRDADSSSRMGEVRRGSASDMATALERPVRPSPELLAIIGGSAPTTSDFRWTLRMALACTMAYASRSGSGSLTGRGDVAEGVVFDERLAALFGVPHATVLELLQLLRRHVTEL
jgi:hypothetical protein